MMIWRRVWMVVGCLVAAGLLLALRYPSAEDALLRFLNSEFPHAKEVTMYSLDPESRWERTEGEASKLEQFWNCDVLGKTALTDAKELSEARQGMLDSVQRHRGATSLCMFDPRHAFRILTREDNVVTIALCFECGDVQFTGIRSRQQSCQIHAGEGLDRLNDILDRHKIPRNVPKGNHN